ncbi:MAG: amidohydrolase [Pseudomonadota bacterium]
MKRIRRYQVKAALFILTSFAISLSAGAVEQIEASKTTALERVDEIANDITQLALEVWQYAELALHETRSSEALANYIQAQEFRVERNVADMPTAFIAEWGAGHPIIGIVAEFDALPGLGNEVVPEKVSRKDEHPDGHGCGHNIFGAGSIGAAVALKTAMQTHDLRGTVRLYGTPAEETLVGKVYMAKAGLFDDLDAALDWHPSIRNTVKNHPGQAMNNFTLEFFGKPAHGAYDPWNGRSALDALEHANYGINLMREHIEPTARIHYVIEHGGKVPNVVPDYARAWYYVRDINREKVDAHYAWILDIAKGAALATQTDHKVTLNTGVHAMLLNRPLQEAAWKNFQRVGLPTYEPNSQEFAKRLQIRFGKEPLGISNDFEALADTAQPSKGGSTDVAEISWIAPTVSIQVAMAGAGIPWHSWAVAASAGLPDASKAAHTAAKVMALTGIDILTDPSLLTAATAAFDVATEGQSYRSPLPPAQRPQITR